MSFAEPIEQFIYRVGAGWQQRQGCNSVFYPTRHGELHCFELPGEGSGPPVLLLHGIAADGLSFSRVIHRLRPHHQRILMLEALAHGRSAVPSDARFTQLLEALEDVVPQFQFDTPPIIVGNSMGGGMALWYATEFPKQVGALVLASPAGAPLSPLKIESLVRSLDLETVHDGWRFVQRLLHRPSVLMWPLSVLVHARFQRQAIRSLLADVHDAPTMTPAKLADLQMPIHMIWGRSDGILPTECASFYQANLPPHAVFEYLDSVGHSPQVEVPVALSQCVQSVSRLMRGRTRTDEQ